MAKKQTTYYIIGAIVIIVIIALVYMMSRPAAEEPAPVSEPEPEPMPEPEPAAPAPSEEVVTTEAGDIQYGTRGILSDLKCEGKTISAIITNNQETAMTAIPKSSQSDLHIQVKGVNMQEFVCDKTEIAPGEYAVCSDLIGNAKQKDNMIKSGVESEVEVAVWFEDNRANRGVETITCSGMESAAEE